MADLSTDPSKPGLCTTTILNSVTILKLVMFWKQFHTGYLYVSKSTDLLHSSRIPILEGSGIIFILFEQFQKLIKSRALFTFFDYLYKISAKCPHHRDRSNYLFFRDNTIEAILL